MSTRVLMVCLGNICRSPLAEGALSGRVEAAGLKGGYAIDSAGTGGWHVGEPPHDGSVQIAATHGIDISRQRSRQVREAELGEWDWIIAMDAANLKHLLAMGAPPDRTRLLLSFIPPGYARDVPDPYYEGGFDRVFDLVDSGCAHLLDFLEAR
jgi:protein-tyrosine phosphatase